MNQDYVSTFLRGGGLICSSQIPQQIGHHDESIADFDIIRKFFLDLDDQCSKMNDLSKQIQSLESQDNILKIIRQIQFHQQFINQASRNHGKLKEYIKQTLDNLETLLDCVTNTILSQRFMSLQILIICNQVSRLIFQYYAQDQSIPLNQERQQSILTIIKQLEESLCQGGDQLYYNGIYYELFIIKICIEICPTNSEEGKEILLNIISGIQASLEELSTDLLKSLALGGVYLYKEIKKRKQTNMFRIIFYLEEYQYRLIEKIQQGQGINKIIKQLAINYNILIRDSKEWLIKCSWIKIMSQLIMYKPIITKKQFDVIKNNYQLQTEWNNLIQKRIVKIVNDQNDIGIIQKNDDNSNTNRILQQQLIKFQIIQNYIINSEKNLPKLEILKGFSNQINDTSNQSNNIIVQQLQNLPIRQFIQQLNEYCEKIIKYIELVQDFIEDISNKNDNRLYLLQQIEQIISETDEIRKNQYQILLHNNIMYDILDAVCNQFAHEEQTNIKISLHLYQTIQYFKITKMLDYNFDNFMDEYQIITNKLVDEYNFDAKILEKYQIIENIEQFNDVDKLIQKLQEINFKGKIICTVEDLITYVKMIFSITQQIQKSSTALISYNLRFFNIRSMLNNSIILDQNHLIQIMENTPKNDFFQLIFNLFSTIQSLGFIYEQIYNNQYILIQKLNFDKEIKLQLGISLQTLKINHRIGELLGFQTTMQNKLKQSNQINTLVDQIQHLNLLEYAYISIFREYKILTDEITQSQTKLEEIIKIQKKENPQSQIEALIQINFIQICQCIDSIQLIEFIKMRLELYIELQKAHFDVNDDISILELIIEDDQQKQQNIQRKEIIQIIKEQNERFNQRSQIMIVENNDYSVFLTYQNYLMNIKHIVEDINLYKLKEQSNNLVQDIALVINHIKLQRYQNKQMDEQKSFLYNQIVEEFQKIFAVDVENVQAQLDLQSSILLQYEKCLALDEVKILIPSYKQLSDRALDNQRLSIKQKALQFINDQYTNEEWRIKDYFYYNCLTFYQYLNENNQKVVGQLLLMARFKETDYRIINTLKGKDQIEQMNALMNNLWEETQHQVNNELQLTLNQLQALQLSIQSEERKEIRDGLIQKHKDLEQQLDQQMKNVNEIGDVLGVTIYFIKEIKRDLALILTKLDNIINSIDQIGQDIKYLRGKSPQQILEIRMQSVLLNKIYQDAQSVYVQMRTQEFDFIKNQERQEQTPLFNFDNQKNGEIDEFLKQNEKSSLLIHGAAGSGKSLTARKIEEYLWLLYYQQFLNKLWSDIKGTPPLIPIFIQLPTLKEPKFNAVEETLLSLYRFDQKQIDQLKDTAINNQIRLIFIMDSYDELPQQYQRVNLIQTNKIYLWKPQNQLQIPKVITTSRSEAFTTNDYRAWFWENDASGFQSFKEVRLLPFDQQQRQDYLKQFSILKLKISIFDLLQVIARNQDRHQILQDTQNIYDQFHQCLNQKLKQDSQSFLLDQQNSQMLIKIIKETQNVTLFNLEQETAFSKLILCLWHQNLYNNSIQSMDLNQLLETPYMLNIVVEVLPQMNNQASQPNNVKQNFIQNYIHLTKRFLESTIKVFDLNQNMVEYQPEVVQSFRQYLNIEKQLISDSQNLWETLIEHQFFNNWNIQSSFESTVSQLQKIQNLINRELFPIKNCNEDMTINLYRSLKSHKLTLFDFFDTFFSQYVENQRQKLIYSNDILDQNQFEQDIYKYATRLSILMFQRQETIIEIKPQGILFREENSNPYNEFFEDADRYGNYRKQIRKCIPLNQKGNFYQFRHKTIQEFLFSKECLTFFEKAYIVIDQLNELLLKLRKGNTKLDLQLIKQEIQLNIQDMSQDEQRKSVLFLELLQSIESYFLNQINLQETFNLGALKFIKAKFSQAPDFQKVLYSLILLSSVNKSYTRLSSNCLLICLQISGFLKDKDFSNMIISEISLDGAIFEHCDLSFTKFDKVSIKGLNLNNSDISQCEWTNIYSNDLPSIQTGESQCYSKLSPNGQLILTYSKEGLHNQYSLTQKKQNIFIWDSNNGNQLVQLKGHTGIEFACFSNNGLLLLSYGLQSLILWNVQTFTKIKEYKIQNRFIDGIAFSEEDDQITYFGQNEIHLISDIEEMKENVIIKSFGKCVAIKFYKNFLLSLTWDKDQMQLYQQQWHQSTGEMISQQIQKIPEQPGVYYRNIYPQLGYYHGDLLFILYNCTIEKWDIDKFQPNGRPFVGHTYEINCIDVSSDGKYLVSGGVDLLVIIYDVKSCNKISALVGHNSRVTSVQFSPDVRQLITCSEDGLIKFWDAKINYQIENSAKILSLSFTPDCNQIVYSNDRGEIVFIDSETGQQINQLVSDEANIYSMCLHPYGKYLLFTTGSQTKIIDLRLMKQVGETFKTQNNIFRVGYSSDGSKIFLMDDHCIFICNSQNWNQLYMQEINRFSKISLNYEYIIIGMVKAGDPRKTLDPNQIYNIRFIELNTQVEKLLINQNPIKNYDLGNNNKIFVGNYFDHIYIWDFAKIENKPQQVIVRTQSEIVAIKISPDCNYLLVGDQNGNIYTVDPQKQYQINVIAFFKSPIKQIIISPDQRFLTAITNYPIQYISLMGEKDNQIYSQIKYSIPQKLNQQTLTQELKFENSSIKSHLGYDLKKIFQKVK